MELPQKQTLLIANLELVSVRLRDQLPPAVSSFHDWLANLSGNLVGDRLAHLPWDVTAGLSGHLDGNLTGDLVALLPGDGGALLLGDGGAFLLGHGAALLPGHGVAHLLGDIVADGLGDGPGGVDALGLWDLDALGAVHIAGLLDWPLVADTLDLGLASWGSSIGSNSASNESGFSFRLGLTLAIAKGPHSTESSKSSITRGSDSSATNGSSSSDDTATNGSTNNGLNGDLALNSNQSSLGLSAVLGGHIGALINNGSIDNWDGLGGALLASGCGALLVGNLLDNVLANLLGDGVADLVGHGVTDLIGHSVADLLVNRVANLLGASVADVVILGLVRGLGDSLALAFWDSGALLGGGDVIDGPADGLGNCDGCNPHGWGDCHGWGSPGNGWGTEAEPGVAPGSCAMASISVASPACSVVPAVVSCGIGLWLAQSQRCNKGENSQKLIHFVCRT